MNRYITTPLKFMRNLFLKIYHLMRHAIRYILIFFAIISAVIAFVLWRINPEDYRTMLENSLSKSLNAEVKIQGEMNTEISLFEQSVLANRIIAINSISRETFLEARQLFVRINLLDILRNKVNIDKLKVIDGNLKLNKVSSPEKGKQSGKSLSRSPELQIHSLSFKNLSIEDTEKKSKWFINEFALNIKNHDEGSRINAELFYKNENVLFELNLTKPLRLDILSNPVDFVMTIEAREIGMFTTEGLYNSSGNSLTGTIDWKLYNPVRLMKLLDAGPVKISRLHLISGFDLKAYGIVLTSMKLKAAGSNEVNGKLSVDWSRGKPRIDGVLRSPYFNVDEVFLDSSEILKEENMDYRITEFNILNKLNSHLDVSIQYFVPTQGVVLKELHADAWLVNGLFSAVNVTGKIGDGMAFGDIYADAAVPKYTHILLDLSLVNASVEQTILDFTNQVPGTIRGGTYTARIVIDTMGSTPRQLLAWDVNFEATLHEPFLAKDALQSIIGRDSFKAWEAKENDINFSCAVIRAKVDDGFLHPQNESIVLESDAVNILASALVNFPAWQMEASVAMQPQKGYSYNISGGAVNFVKATGRINNPKISFSLFSGTAENRSPFGFDIFGKSLNLVKNVSETTVGSIPYVSQVATVFQDSHPCKTAKKKKLPQEFNKDILDHPIEESIVIMRNSIKEKDSKLRKKLGTKNF